jgi:hypothetical protein
VLESRREIERRVAFDFYDDSAMPKPTRTDLAREKAIAFEMQYKRLPFRDIERAARKLHTAILNSAKLLPRYSTPDYALRADPGLVWRRLRDGFDLVGVKSAARTYRLRAWLAERNVSLPPHMVPVLARCENHAEIRFLLPILREIPWKAQRSDRSMRGTPLDRVVSGAVGVHIQFPVGLYRVDFLIGRLGSKTTPPTAIDIIRRREPHERDITAILEGTAAAARMAGYPYKAVADADCEKEGEWWADLLREGVANRRRGPPPHLD